MFGALPSSTLFPYTTLFRSIRPEPASRRARASTLWAAGVCPASRDGRDGGPAVEEPRSWVTSCRTRDRSEEHTSELQSRRELVCRLLLEKKKEGEFCLQDPE